MGLSSSTASSFVLACCLAAGLATSLTAARASPGPIEQDVQNLPPFYGKIAAACRRVKAEHCTAPQCQAVTTLCQVFDIIDKGEATMMGITRYLTPDQPYVEERQLHRALLDHPNRFGPICALLTGLASRYGRPGARHDVDEDLYVGVHALDLALRMDGWGKPACLPAVLAAMPRTADADEAIGNARSMCEDEPVARNPCRRISR